MKSSIQHETKSELEVFEEITKCSKCLSGENICSHHAVIVKEILLKDIKSDIEKLTVKKQIKKLQIS